MDKLTEALLLMGKDMEKSPENWVFLTDDEHVEIHYLTTTIRVNSIIIRYDKSLSKKFTICRPAENDTFLFFPVVMINNNYDKMLHSIAILREYRRDKLADYLAYRFTVFTKGCQAEK